MTYHGLYKNVQLRQREVEFPPLLSSLPCAAVIGPPDVRLKSGSGALHVDLSGPFAEREQGRWPLKKYYGSWNYRILYWKKGSTDTDLTSASWVL